jgi:hypothetical protein
MQANHMRGGLAKATGPPLGGSERGGVQNELLCIHIVCCSRLQTAHKGAMAQLRLGVSTCGQGIGLSMITTNKRLYIPP